MNKLLISLSLLVSVSSFAQMPDTTGIYGERRDSLGASMAVGHAPGNFLSRTKDMRVEVISASGLCKMACCNLAESFENSASVTVGYSDAVTGARQIRLLGQSGIYTQMLDENRPVMRGLSAPWGLNFVPSQWLESIQVAKGVTSVINGVESMTGQINVEHRKPTDEKPLYVQASMMNDTKADVNVVSSLQLDEAGKWSTVILGHADGNLRAMDHNSDGFMDDPLSRNLSVANRWLYFSPSGLQVRFGASYVHDHRLGGQTAGGSWTSWNSEFAPGAWQADITNRRADAYVKVGVPLNEANTSNVAAVVDYNWQSLGSCFGTRGYDASQHSAFINLLYQNQDSESHHFTLGLSGMYDFYDETLFGAASKTGLYNTALFGEYTFRDGERFSAIAGLRGEWYNLAGFRFSPRLTLKWKPIDQLVLRANGGRGLRYSTPIVDNIGVMSTSKAILGEPGSHPLEDSWTFGANATWYLPWDEEEATWLSLDYFHTGFTEQMLVDYDADRIAFYTLGSLDGGRSYTDNWQADFSTEIFEGFTLTLTGRFTDARQSLKWQSEDVKPMTSLYKGVLNLQYATHLNKWIFDFTASVNGPCRVWDFMRGMNGRYADGMTRAYPLLYAQITKRFKGFDIYAGGENLTGFTQEDPIISSSDPSAAGFDASCIWGPLMGARFYAGIRLTIWKTE